MNPARHRVQLVAGGNTELARQASRVARTLVRHWSRSIPVGDADWQALETELDRWQTGTAVFWWRDDDAVAATPALDRLLALRASIGIPLALAVIPASARESLASALDASGPGAVRVLTHGWEHRDWSRPGEAKSELAACRTAADVEAELRQGRERLISLFGPRALPVLVPPFNQISPHLIAGVRAAGFRYLSIDGDFALLGLPSRNVHADVMDWRSETGVAADRIVRDIAVALRLRRYGLVDRRQPVGVMTHHLVHDDTAWSVTQTVLERLKAHPAVTFPAIPEIFES